MFLRSFVGNPEGFRIKARLGSMNSGRWFRDPPIGGSLFVTRKRIGFEFGQLLDIPFPPAVACLRCAPTARHPSPML